ncbi:hypothetical protein EYF80_034471 [Liparis tanakae]|uniref:Uncharacterized protein n=1 Tax=Liparis tanakae TaxID=230148 RepID=A0A4Z2GPQ6_9TELE|nr:hypothetical protein EYF80_034471 [Liparis tanakae]
MVAMTKALESTVAKVMTANRTDNEIWRLSSVASLQGGGGMASGGSCHFPSVTQLSYVPHVGDLLAPRSPPLAGLSGSLDLLP